MAGFFNFILAHAGDAADPELLHWIKERLDQILGPSPWALVGIIGFFIFAIPISITTVYLMENSRRAAEERSTKVNRDT
ncbi:MAG: hypothetical protein VYA78_06230, partial [Chloroflexota bacterium]|nr:hypothetical protein [Chloroflexota bacterium]